MKQIKTIDINCKEWFDKVNGNSYFAGTVTINYGMDDGQTINLPYQYGYGDHYRDMAFKALEEANLTQDVEHYSNGSSEQLWQYCQRHNIILRANKVTGCKKRELMEY